MYRIKYIAPRCWYLIHPDGYWIGPGLGEFDSPAAALDWLARKLARR